MKSARLNVFQRLVRQWDSVYPYNAAQVLHVNGSPDLAALQRSWSSCLSALGLGPVRVRGRTIRIEPLNGRAEESIVPLIPANTSLDELISTEMNRRFEAGDLPLRPFILPDGDSFYMGVVYQHWVADSASIRLVLAEWFTRVYDPAASSDAPAELPRGGYWSLFGPHRSRWGLGDQILSLMRSASRFRRVMKLRTQGSSDFRMRYALHRVPHRVLAKLVALARRSGVTVNDLFLAAIADVCDRFNPVRRISRRTDLALGIIVDLRPASRNDMARVFGLFLGFANIVCRREDLRHWPRLVKQIARQTRRHKEKDSPQGSAVWMAAALTAAWVTPRDKTFSFYRKHMPLAGGISNINGNRTWVAKYHPSVIREYVRVSPTGPMVPLVFNTTTLGDDLVFSLTYRTSLFSDEHAGKIAATFMSRLEQLAECGDALLTEP